MILAHCAGKTRLCQSRLELLVNFRVFIGELNLRAPPFCALGIGSRFLSHGYGSLLASAPGFDSELATHHRSGIKMLMEPAVGRNEQASGFQVDLDSFFVVIKGPEPVVSSPSKMSR